MLPGVAGHDVAEAGAGLLCGRRCLLLRGEVALDEAGAEPPALGNGGPVLQRPLPNVGWFRCGMRRGCRRAFVGGDVLFPCALGLLRPADGGRSRRCRAQGGLEIGQEFVELARREDAGAVRACLAQLVSHYLAVPDRVSLSALVNRRRRPGEGEVGRCDASLAAVAQNPRAGRPGIELIRESH